MTPTGDVPVLIAGAGPIGLTAAIELARRGIDVRIVDPVLQRPRYAKAVGVQPRTLEIFEGMGVVGVVRPILAAGVEMRGRSCSTPTALPTSPSSTPSPPQRGGPRTDTWTSM